MKNGQHGVGKWVIAKKCVGKTGKPWYALESPWFGAADRVKKFFAPTKFRRAEEQNVKKIDFENFLN